MSLQFSANQYDQAYKPTALGNWAVPKQFCGIRPHKRTGRTRIIANNRGHLLPGVPKASASPWSNFIGTWHLPKKINRKTADKLNGTSSKKEQCQCVKLKHTDETAGTVPAKDSTSNVGDGTEKLDIEVPPVSDSKEDNVLEEEGNKENVDRGNAIPYVPGDLTESKYRPDSYDLLAADRFGQNKEQFRDSSKGYPQYKTDYSVLPQLPNTISRDDVEQFYTEQKAMAQMDPKQEKSASKKLPSPIISAISNFNLAKKLHKENLEHDPLPDTITNAMYRKLQMQRSQQDPGLALDEDNLATGVGWKGYPGYGPTKCTKLKVYRPKTSVQINKAEGSRPSSVCSFDKKWRFIRQKKVTPIELAICWDLTPEDPQDEPKRPVHIDGSNGSMAPAVFSLVHTPHEEESPKSSDAGAPLFDKAPPKAPDETDFVLDRPNTCLRRLSKDAKLDDSLSKKRAKSAYNLNNDRQEGCDCNIHQSTPNLNQCAPRPKSRLCMACEMKNISIKDRRPQNEFKAAFKAGVPRKYKDKRQDYPEHWRLATVYQHSYKPIEGRKRPLLATIFK